MLLLVPLCWLLCYWLLCIVFLAVLLVSVCTGLMYCRACWGVLCLLLCCWCPSSLGVCVLLKYKKEKIEKNKNTNKYCDFQRFKKLLCVKGKLGGRFGRYPHVKKKASPPACLMINYYYIALSFACLVFLAGCCAVCVFYLPWCVTALLITTIH